MKTISSVLLASVVLMIAAACTTARHRMRFAALRAHSGDIADLTLSGCLTPSPLGAQALFVDCDSARNGKAEDAVDVGFGAVEGPAVAAGEYICVTLSGTYYDLDDQSIVTGASFGKICIFGAEQWEVVECN